jgi:hypothetical protein
MWLRIKGLTNSVPIRDRVFIMRKTTIPRRKRLKIANYGTIRACIYKGGVSNVIYRKLKTRTSKQMEIQL